MEGGERERKRRAQWKEKDMGVDIKVARMIESRVEIKEVDGIHVEAPDQWVKVRKK